MVAKIYGHNQRRVDEEIYYCIGQGEEYTMYVSDLTEGNEYQWHLDKEEILDATKCELHHN